MDVFAHALWASAGVAYASRRVRISRPAVVGVVALAVLPDIVQLLPIVGWVIAGDGTFADLRSFSIAVPGQEPHLPPLVQLLSHHLHCVMHSAVIATAVTLLSWLPRRRLWIPLAGWWSHIVIDIFTHSAAYYEVPVLYPFTERGFDGIAWNQPWFQAINYGALAVCLVWLYVTRFRAPR